MHSKRLSGRGVAAMLGAAFLACAPVAAGAQEAAKAPEGIAVGNPAHLVGELRKWEACGVDRVNFLLNAAENIPQEQVLNSLRLFANEVMPAFAGSQAPAAAGGSR